MATDNDLENVQDIVNNLNHVYFMSFIGDVCYFLGCQSTLTVGDADVPGDLIVEQNFPFPQTVAVIDHREGELTESDLREYIESCSESTKLTVITHSKPTDAALSLVNDTVAIIGTRDLAHTILDMEIVDLLASHIQDNDLSDDHAEALDGLGYGPISNHSDDSANLYPSTSNQFFDLKILGYDFHETPERGNSGVIVAMEIQSKRDDLDISPNRFTFHDSDGYTYSGLRGGGGTPDKEFKNELEEVLPGQWNKSGIGGSLSISGGGRSKFIQYFRCEDAKKISKVRYHAELLRHLLDISDDKIEDHYGVSESSGPREKYGSWEEFIFEIPIEGEQRERLNSLPDDIQTALDSL